MKRTKDEDKKLAKALELMVLSVGAGVGVPGTMQLSEVMRNIERKQKKTSVRKTSVRR